MKAFLWRIVYAAFFVIALRIVLPLFFAVVGLSMGALLNLILVVVALGAIAYVLFGPPPPMPF